MLKGLALTPPIIGRIAIGRVVRKDGKRQPEKDDEFTITSQVQNKDGWVPHPIDETLRSTQGAKLRCIPVRLLFNDPDLNLRANYTLFDRANGRPLCIGDGQTCRRVTSAGMQTMPCPTPDACEVGSGGCKPYGRLNVRIGVDDELGSFILRTTGFNSIRTLAARLRYFNAVTHGLLSTLPLDLRLRGKSTTLSHRAPIYYVDLTVRSGVPMGEAIGTARADDQARKTQGFDQEALDAAARAGFAAGAFEESAEESADAVDEFFPAETPLETAHQRDVTASKQSLADKLRHRTAAS
jgi:hypothetical protein